MVETRLVTIGLRGPLLTGPRPVTVVSNLERRQVDALPDDTAQVAGLRVCVPPRGFTEVTLATPAVSELPGGQVNYADSNTPRRGGVLVATIAESDESAGACTPRQGGAQARAAT